MPNDRPKISSQVIEQASEWFVLMREVSVSDGDREQFSSWLRASPQHVGAYIEIARMWDDAPHVSASLSVSIESQSLSNIRRLPGSRSFEEGVQQPFGGTLVRTSARNFHPLRLVAGVLIASAIGLAMWWFMDSGLTYSNSVAEQRVITLEDGSVVHLDSRSKLSVHFSPLQRKIELSEGQALFQVAHDTRRPFIVASGGVAVRAVGTEFNVNGLRDHTVVTVMEGRVRLAGIVGSVDASLAAGQQATVDRHGHVEVQSNADLASATGWLQHRLMFQGSRLADVVEEFNRYNRTAIVLTDPEFADMRINAVFLSTDSTSLLQFLSRREGVRVERSGDGIRVYRDQ